MDEKEYGKGLHGEYRKDWRNDEEYARDIKEGHRIEKEIIEAYAEHIRTKYHMDVVVEDNGVDNSGEVIDEDKVTTDADYRINGALIEVKYINNKATEFRFKKDQLDSYIKQGATVLFVNGWNTDEPRFTLMKRRDLMTIRHTKKAKQFRAWGFKECYFLKAYSFKWTKFEGLKK